MIRKPDENVLLLCPLNQRFCSALFTIIHIWWEVILSSTLREIDLHGLHICITWFTLYGIRTPLFSLNENATQTFECQSHCSGYGVAIGCYGPCIVPQATTVASQW